MNRIKNITLKVSVLIIMVLCVNLTVYADDGQPTQKEQLAFEKINRVMNKLGYE